jgi:hypothetical protein
MHGLRRRFPRSRICDRRVQPSSKRQTSSTSRKLGASHRLIAPSHTFTLPSLDGVKHRFEVSYGVDAALPPARMLIDKGLLVGKHFGMAGSTIEVLRNALTEIVMNASGSDQRDEFDVEIQLTDQFGDRRTSEDCLFFVWNCRKGTEYIPLRPVFDALKQDPDRERLMASLYHWIYRASSKLCWIFGFDEASWTCTERRAWYEESRESGEEDGAPEFADPSTVVRYIRDAKQLRLKEYEIDGAIASIRKPALRDAFQKAHNTYVLSHQIRLPDMTKECQEIVGEAEYYMGEDLPAIGISHWSDDAIAAWLDDVCQEIFNSGVEGRPRVVRCFRPNDSARFSQILTALPKMVHVSLALSEWVRTVREMGNAGHYSDR